MYVNSGLGEGLLMDVAQFFIHCYLSHIGCNTILDHLKLIGVDHGLHTFGSIAWILGNSKRSWTCSRMPVVVDIINLHCYASFDIIFLSFESILVV